MSSCSKKEPEDIYIIYTNDIHSFIDNTKYDWKSSSPTTELQSDLQAGLK